MINSYSTNATHDYIARVSSLLPNRGRVYDHDFWGARVCKRGVHVMEADMKQQLNSGIQASKRVSPVRLYDMSCSFLIWIVLQVDTQCDASTVKCLCYV